MVSDPNILRAKIGIFMTNDGKRYEALVHMIESSISPDSIIEHDVNLPILNSTSGATTQCDIVIRNGPVSRQTITIVEVQDRATKVKPNDFRGWKQKKEDVVINKTSKIKYILTLNIVS